jgi:hypothetical protein
MECAIMLEKTAGFFLGILNVLLLGLVGAAFLIPDAGRYIRIKRM